jgi:signal transduction histidine kinase/CheY-like chemotaxis protein
MASRDGSIADTSSEAPSWPPGDGPLATCIRTFPWAETSLGRIETWPQRLQALVELTLADQNVASIVCGDERILLYNDAAAGLYGDRHPTALGRALPEMFPEGWRAVGPLYARAFAGETVQLPAEPVDVDGSGERVFEATLTPLRDEGGRVAWVHMTGVDVTTRTKAERTRDQHARELRELAERHTFLLELSDALRSLALTDAIQSEACRRLAEHLRVDRAYYVEVDETAGVARVERDFVREATPSLAGVHRLADFAWSVAILRQGECHVVTDTQDSPLVPVADRSACSALQIIACAGAPLIKEGRLVGALCVTQSRPRRWAPEEIGLLRDVGERIWAAVERARAEAALRDADARKDAFLATLAHELRNPLAPIRQAMMLLRREPSSHPVRELHNIVERQVEHMVRLVNDLLDVSRISRGVVELQRDSLDLRDVLEAAIEIARPAIDRGRHGLTVELPRQPLPVEGDAIRLAQVFGNLLNNAAKYGEDGGRIMVCAFRESADVVVDVRDTGIGISAEELPRLFQMFGQLHPHDSRTPGGLGIGLHLAQQLVQMHGGTLGATSEGLGRGSTFTVRLPSVGEGARAARREPTLTGQELQGQRLLVVDDNKDAAQTLAALLRMRGAEVTVEYDGDSALARLDSWPASAVLLDIGMPGMSGHEVARRIRTQRRFAGVRLVALTGWGQDEDRRRSSDAGFDHHLTKPVELDALLSVLCEAQRT